MITHSYHNHLLLGSNYLNLLRRTILQSLLPLFGRPHEVVVVDPT